VAVAAGGGALDAGCEDGRGREYNAAKRFFSSSAVSRFGAAPVVAGVVEVADVALTSCNDPLAGPGPAGPAETGIPVSAIVGVIAGPCPPDGSTVTEGAVEVAVVEVEAAGISAGDWFNSCGLIAVDGCVATWDSVEDLVTVRGGE